MEEAGKAEEARRRQLGRRIRRARKAKGWTQDRLAREVSVTMTTVSRWERGQHETDLDTLTVIARAFGTTVSDLVKDLDVSEEAELELADRVARVEAHVERLERRLDEQDQPPASQDD